MKGQAKPLRGRSPAKRLFAAIVSLCMIVSLLPTTAFAEAGVQDSIVIAGTSGLCEHHTEHTADCGYTEGTAEISCSHEHDESCGGLIDPEACNHIHDEACGYVPATEGTPCTYVCEICNAQDSGNPVTPSDAQPEECTCETLCTGEEVNGDCPVCSAEGAELDKVCVGVAPMLPVTALAADTNTVYVGGVALAGSSDSIVYATTNESGEVITEGATADNYNIKWDGNTLTLKGAYITKEVSTPGLSSPVEGAAIGVYNQSGDANLTITLEGTNTIKDVSAAIHVFAPSSSASLTITGDGILSASSGYNPGIRVQSNTGNGTLAITGAKVTASSSYSGNGVQIRCGDSANASLTVNGGSLTATGSGATFAGIIMQFGSSTSGSGTPTVTVSDNAIVRANGSAGGITSNSSAEVHTAAGTGESGGIVFDNGTGTVYGDVELQEDLEIGEGESLTLDDGANLSAGDHNVIVDGGTLDENLVNSLGNSVKYAPTITTASLPDGTVGTPYTAKLEADGTAPITWSVSAGSLPDGLNLNKDTGEISGTPSAEVTSTFTVTANSTYGSDSRELTLKIEKPAFIPVTGLELSKNSLTLQEKDSDTLTVTVKPADATNQDVIWESSNTSIATVSADGTVTAISAGTATITATAQDGSGVSASCTVTVTHGKMVHIPKKDATCTVDGNTEYWTCDTCGKYFSDANGDTEIEKDSWIISAINHDWNDAVYTWSEDGSTCTAARTCKHDSTHTETATATVTGARTKAPTCTEKGETTYTATFEADWAVTQTKVLADIPATGHSYGEPEWSWSEDGKTCTVSFTCKNDAAHKETPKVTVTSKVKTPATCTEKGVTTYTATVEFNGKTCTDTKDVADIPATGHSYGEPEWSWSEDGKTCTVTFTCKNDAAHKETPKVTVTSKVKTPATCTEKGVTTYTAAVEFNGQTYTDTKDMADIPATGHSYDNGKCTVCGAISSDFKAVITAGANGSWQKGTKDSLSFTSNAAYKHFRKVQVDGKDLDAANYTVKEGSTIVTLKAEYLETLSVGKHTLAIVSDTGTAVAEFTIQAAPATDNTRYYTCQSCGHHDWTATDAGYRCDYCGRVITEQISGYPNVKGVYTAPTASPAASTAPGSPATGDESNLVLWVVVLAAGSAALAGSFLIQRKKEQ